MALQIFYSCSQATGGRMLWSVINFEVSLSLCAERFAAYRYGSRSSVDDMSDIEHEVGRFPARNGQSQASELSLAVRKTSGSDSGRKNSVSCRWQGTAWYNAHLNRVNISDLINKYPLYLNLTSTLEDLGVCDGCCLGSWRVAFLMRLGCSSLLA